MEPEGSLPQSQVPATCPYPEPTRFNPYPPHPTYLRSILILSSHLRLGKKKFIEQKMSLLFLNRAIFIYFYVYIPTKLHLNPLN